MPWDLTQGVRQRLAALSPQARMALDAACRARLLVESGADAYQVAHDVIRVELA